MIALLSALSSAVSATQIVVVVNESSAITSLSEAEVAALFLRQVQTVSNTPVRQIDLPADDNLRQRFYASITQLNAQQLQAQWARQVFSGKATMPKEVRSSPDLIALVRQRVDAIGYADGRDVTPGVRVVFTLQKGE